MQYNFYVPKEKQYIIRMLEKAAKQQNRAKNDIVLDALEKYLPGEPTELGSFHLGDFTMPERAQLYERRLRVDTD